MPVAGYTKRGVSRGGGRLAPLREKQGGAPPRPLSSAWSAPLWAGGSIAPPGPGEGPAAGPGGGLGCGGGVCAQAARASHYPCPPGGRPCPSLCCWARAFVWLRGRCPAPGGRRSARSREGLLVCPPLRRAAFCRAWPAAAPPVSLAGQNSASRAVFDLGRREGAAAAHQ